jgi:L-lactate dehydrogenase (cytochrome)
MTWDDIPFFRENTDMKICLKGIQSAEDAVLAYKAGVDGIVVSNHGGRNCDTARPSLEVLVEVMDALRAAKYDDSRFEVYLDGGVHRGGDIFKALAIGARAVGIGKAALLGMSAYGQEGVEKTLDILRDEFESTMQFMGCPSLKVMISQCFDNLGCLGGGVSMYIGCCYGMYLCTSCIPYFVLN